MTVGAGHAAVGPLALEAVHDLLNGVSTAGCDVPERASDQAPLPSAARTESAAKCAQRGHGKIVMLDEAFAVERGSVDAQPAKLRILPEARLDVNQPDRRREVLESRGQEALAYAASHLVRVTARERRTTALGLLLIRSNSRR
jgi:hypothetical protein